MHNILICPYCKTELHKYFIYKNNPRFGIYRCDCDSYPLLNNVIYIQKNDLLINKKAVAYIRRGEIYRALWICLSSFARTHKIIVLLLYVLIQFRIPVSYYLLLRMLYLVGPSRAWFRYLLKRHSYHDYRVGVQMITNKLKTYAIVVDVGCGTSRLIRDLADSSISYYGIDKSFLSLFIASLCIKGNNVKLICSDIENGIPLKNSVADVVSFLDSFSWVYNKTQVIRESARILKNNGRLIITNLHRELPATSLWGYHVGIKQLVGLIYPLFFHIQFTNNKIDKRGDVLFVYRKTINQEGYSCQAIKK